MGRPNRSHNLLIVSDLHLAEGRNDEAGEHYYGHDAFLYDASFVRFLKYHEQRRREAAERVQRRRHAPDGDRADDEARHKDELLSRPWRLVLAGDTFDFWDVARVPGDLDDLRLEIGKRLQEFRGYQAASNWLEDQEARLEHADKSGELPMERSYDEIRAEIDNLGLRHGPHRRALENLVWWIEMLIQKPGLELSKTEQRHGLGTAWQEVAWKLTHVYRGHREFFAALAWFIACGNELVLLKGNHDLELYWPQIHEGHLPHILIDAYRDILDGAPIGPSFDTFPPEFLSNLPDVQQFKAFLPEYGANVTEGAHQGAKKRFTFHEWFYCEGDLVYIEHGNQYEPLDSSVRFLAPKLPSDPRKIELPWGAFMTRYVYNKIVAVHPFAVNLKPEERIIHWMVNHDLFRILGILVAEFPGVVRALGRAFKQGLRGKWILGDRSFLGIIPRLTYDVIQLLTPGLWEEDERNQREQDQKVREIVDAYVPDGGAPSVDQQDEGFPEQELVAEQARKVNRRKLYSRFLQHLGAFGITLLLVLTGLDWLTRRGRPDWVVPLLGIFGATVFVGGVLDLVNMKSVAQQTLGEVLLQLGGTGFMVGLIAALFLARWLGWSGGTQLLVIALPFALAVSGGFLLKRAEDTWEKTFFPKMVSAAWPAHVLHSSASVLKEVSFFGFIASILIFLSPREGMQAIPWLLASVSLFIAGWLVSRLNTLYVERRDLTRVVDRWLEAVNRWSRILATVVVGIIIVALVISLIAPVAGSLFEGVAGADGIVNLARMVDESATGPGPVGGVPRLMVLFLVLGAVILLETRVRGFFRSRLQGGVYAAPVNPGPGLQAAKWAGRDRYDWGARRVLKDQLQAIDDLARVEQRRFANNMLKILSFFLPPISMLILVIGIVGLGAAVGSVSGLVGNVDPTGGLSLSALMAFVYWLLRQFSASIQRQDPASGFGDLFHRMATDIASILREDVVGDGRGMGTPRYFVFGHDHWADSKMIEVPAGSRSDGPEESGRRWYLNSGTWLRGYVEEQRRQEVNENHSTFVQIIPDQSGEETPKVLRWNDGANQPEYVVRRDEPRSAGELLWDRWAQLSPRLLIWVLLLSVSALVVMTLNSQLFSDSLPFVWAIGLWLLVGAYGPLSDWLGRWRKQATK